MAGQPALPWQAHLWSSPHQCLLGDLSCPLFPKVSLPTGVQLLGGGEGGSTKWPEKKGVKEVAAFFSSRLCSGIVCCHQASLGVVAVLSTWNTITVHHLTLVF